MMSGVLSCNKSNNFTLFFPNTSLCKSDTWAIRNPENPAGTRLPEIIIIFTIKALLPHSVQIRKNNSNTPSMPSFFRPFFINCLFMASHLFYCACFFIPLVRNNFLLWKLFNCNLCVIFLYHFCFHVFTSPFQDKNKLYFYLRLFIQTVNQMVDYKIKSFHVIL